MNDLAAPRQCPAHQNIDRRKSAEIAALNTKPNEGAHWVK